MSDFEPNNWKWYPIKDSDNYEKASETITAKGGKIASILYLREKNNDHNPFQPVVDWFLDLGPITPYEEAIFFDIKGKKLGTISIFENQVVFYISETSEEAIVSSVLINHLPYIAGLLAKDPSICIEDLVSKCAVTFKIPIGELFPPKHSKLAECIAYMPLSRLLPNLTN